MKVFILGFVFAAIAVPAVSAELLRGPLVVISNGTGNTPAFAVGPTQWYAKNAPVLPRGYLYDNSFVNFKPLFSYVDSVNWSIASLHSFEGYEKKRFFRLPSGAKIVRELDGQWRWPVGAELAKVLRVKTSHGWVEAELRLERKIADGSDERANWAMAAYTRDPRDQSWRVVTWPHLVEFIDGRQYVLTPPEGCLTCHWRAPQSPVDYGRGSEFVYGANNELLTGQTRLRYSTWLTTPDLQWQSQELGHSDEEDWVDVETANVHVVKENQKLFAPYIRK
jgi:hypothetical protein